MARWRPRLGPCSCCMLGSWGTRAIQRRSSACSQRARRLGFKTKLFKLFGDNNLGEQELRQRRYNALSRACESIGTKYICTAHHQDDNAEGFLMSLLGVGGGASGAAMGAYEPMEKYVIVRPFVALNKKNLLLPLSLSSCTDFVIDNLDQDRVGQRAWVRHEILPELAGHESHINERLAYFAEQERAKKAILARLAQDFGYLV